MFREQGVDMKVSLAAFADEAADGFADQLDILAAENIPYIELRMLDGLNVADITVEQARTYAEALRSAGIAVWAIGSPLGKVELSADFDTYMQKAAHVFELAQIFETRRVRMFSFFTDSYDKDESEVIRRLCALVRLADGYGVTLCHENEKGIYGDTAARCARLLDGVAGLKCVFDPANFVQCGQNVGRALDLLGDRVDYYHIKDAKHNGTVTPAGQGDGMLDMLIGSLDRDCTLTVEPHLAVFTGYSEMDKTPMANVYSYPSRRAAFSAAVAALRTLLEKHSFRADGGAWIKRLDRIA